MTAAEALPTPVIRSATGKELATLIIPSWMESYARSLPAKMMRADARYGPGRERYWQGQRGKIERVLSTSTVSVRVCDIEGTIAGWCCDDQSKRELWYVYVRETFRRQGIARSLCGWIEDAHSPVFLMGMPAPWFTRGSQDGTSAPLWKPHQVIDTITPC